MWKLWRKSPPRPRSQQSARPHQLGRVGRQTAVRATLLSILTLLSAVACAADAGIPEGFEATIESARANLLAQDDFPLSTYSFQRLRCRVDGGRLVIFGRGSPWGASGYGYAMQGPGADPDGWGGGIGVIDIDHDSEIAHFFGESPEAPCQPPG